MLVKMPYLEKVCTIGQKLILCAAAGKPEIISKIRKFVAYFEKLRAQ